MKHGEWESITAARLSPVSLDVIGALDLPPGITLQGYSVHIVGENLAKLQGTMIVSGERAANLCRAIQLYSPSGKNQED